MTWELIVVVVCFLSSVGPRGDTSPLVNVGHAISGFAAREMDGSAMTGNDWDSGAYRNEK